MLFYRTLVTVCALPVLLVLLWQRARHKIDVESFRAMLGAAPNGPFDIWVHGASNGELTSVRPLLDQIMAMHPTCQCLITANTQTGRALARKWSLPQTQVAAPPLDHRASVARFIGRSQPKLALIVENEVWPNRIVELSRRRCPIVNVGARISERSAARWARFGGLTRRVFPAMSLVVPQDAASAARYETLGVPQSRVIAALNLKAAVPIGPDAVDLPAFDRSNTVLAAATHDGEEALIFEAFKSAIEMRASLRLIVAPRHPRRASDILEIAEGLGLGIAQRTRGDVPSQARPVYLADTMGEMASWYRRASVTFVGGSLVDKGGHTPFEPAQAGTALLHGPHVTNFRDAYAALGKAGGAQVVGDRDDLAARFVGLPGSAEAERMAGRASEVLKSAADPAALKELAETIIEMLNARS